LIKRVPQTQKIHYDIRDLRAVCELARQGGFKHAANALAITPSALSRRVAKLEEVIGGLIVNRTTRSIALTALGRRLVTRCEPLLRELDESVDESSRIARGMEVAMISVLRQLPRNVRIMKAVRHAAINVSRTTPLIALRTKID